MSAPAKAIWGCAALSAVCFITLAVISKLWIEPAGMVIFDSRVRGYSPAEAQAFLEAITAAQTQTYLGLFHQIDRVFPITLSLSLGGAIWLNTQGANTILRTIAVLSPCVYLALDLAENAAVAQMLRTGSVASEASILQASALTQGKWICLGVAAILLVWAWRVTPKTRERAA